MRKLVGCCLHPREKESKTQARKFIQWLHNWFRDKVYIFWQLVIWFKCHGGVWSHLRLVLIFQCHCPSNIISEEHPHSPLKLWQVTIIRPTNLKWWKILLFISGLDTINCRKLLAICWYDLREMYFSFPAAMIRACLSHKVWFPASRVK